MLRLSLNESKGGQNTFHLNDQLGIDRLDNRKSLTIEVIKVSMVYFTEQSTSQLDVSWLEKQLVA